eukprot:scaffold66860_cov43-Phaeocystis_antarctica.AAC.1
MPSLEPWQTTAVFHSHRWPGLVGASPLAASPSTPLTCGGEVIACRNQDVNGLGDTQGATPIRQDASSGKNLLGTVLPQCRMNALAFLHASRITVHTWRHTRGVVVVVVV